MGGGCIPSRFCQSWPKVARTRTWFVEYQEKVVGGILVSDEIRAQSLLSWGFGGGGAEVAGGRVGRRGWVVAWQRREGCSSIDRYPTTSWGRAALQDGFITLREESAMLLCSNLVLAVGNDFGVAAVTPSSAYPPTSFAILPLGFIASLIQDDPVYAQFREMLLPCS